MKPFDLIRTAKALTDSKARPRRTDLCRARSSVYFALFHAAARMAADTWIGPNKKNRGEHAWVQVYRALNHRTAKSVCQNETLLKRFPTILQDFAFNFVVMQEHRHLADYHPSARIDKSTVIREIAIAEELLRKLSKIPLKHRRAFSALLLLGNPDKRTDRGDPRSGDTKGERQR